MPDPSWTERVRPWLGQDYELDRLWTEHEQLEQELEALDKVKWLNQEQDIERTRLQKQKLAGKDRMLEIVRGFEASTTSGGRVAGGAPSTAR